MVNNEKISFNALGRLSAHLVPVGDIINYKEDGKRSNRSTQQCTISITHSILGHSLQQFPWQHCIIKSSLSMIGSGLVIVEMVGAADRLP